MCFGLGLWGLGIFLHPLSKASLQSYVMHITWDSQTCTLCWPQSPPFLSPPAPCKAMPGSCERAGLPVRALCLAQADTARLLNMSLSSFLLTCPSFSLANLNKQRPVAAAPAPPEMGKFSRRDRRNRQQWPPEHIPGIIQLLQEPCGPFSCPQSSDTSLAGLTPKMWL